MNKDLQFFVKGIHGRGLLVWLPSSETTKISELLGLLKATLPTTQAGPIDVIEESTGRPIGADTMVSSLECRNLLVKDRFIRHTARHLEALKAQSPALAGFEVLPDSSVFRLKFNLPGLVRLEKIGPPRIFLRGRHELLMILPGSFPEVAPILVWQTPVFHPNIAADSEVWPPGLHWGNTTNVVALVEALGETLVGLRTATKGPLNLTMRRPLNPEASSWFRKPLRL